VLVLPAAALLFAALFTVRLLVNDPDAFIAILYIVPVVLIAAEYGAIAGFLSGVGALGLVFAWTLIEAVHVGVLGYVSREAAVLVAGVVVGRISERLRYDSAQRRRAQRHVAVYAEQLERANEHLVRSVERLEAVGEIARAVGGETDLQRALTVILAHAREIVAVRTLVAYLIESDELVAVETVGLPGDVVRRMPVNGSRFGEAVLARRPAHVTADDRSAIVVPLAFRGEILGVLAGIDTVGGRPFEPEDQELLMSVAASAATAVATARSVATARLRFSLEASEQARARWARELHDETLQGLTGARMVLSAGLARDELGPLRRAAQAADAHLAEEIRKLRELIAELRPAALDDLGLGPAIESLANRQAAIGRFSVELGIALGRSRLARDTENAIYRIVQEALNNAVKHAGARRVSLRVDQLSDHVEINVRDDGRGFDPGAIREGFGLTGMRERAVLEGGRLSVSSAQGGPTCVTAVLPLRGVSSGNGLGGHVVPV
jgi:signal transduction histidine kinase